MSKLQENKMTMYEGVLAFFERNNSVTDGLPMMAGPINDLTDTVAEIRQARQERATLKPGKTLHKGKAKKTLVTAMMPIVTALNVFARMTDNAELQTLSNYKRSKLQRMRDTTLVTLSGVSHTQAQQYQADLASYLVTEAMVTTLQEARDTFSTAIGTQEDSQALKKTATASLAELFDETDDILRDKLDQFAELLRETQPTFYNEYKAARVIKNL